MIAVVRPDSWGFPLFLHVFGAMVLFGALLATVTVSVVGLRVPVLARSAFWALLAGAVPAWVLMRIGHRRPRPGHPAARDRLRLLVATLRQGRRGARRCGAVGDLPDPAGGRLARDVRQVVVAAGLTEPVDRD
jgi:hypothetical protein